MNSRELLIQRIAKIFGDGEELFASTVLIDYLILNPNTGHINLEFVRQLGSAAGAQLTDKGILRSLQYLSGDSVRLIDVCFELIEDEWRIFDLNQEQVQAARDEKINPITGFDDSEILNRIFMFYRPQHDALARLEGG